MLLEALPVLNKQSILSTSAAVRSIALEAATTASLKLDSATEPAAPAPSSTLKIPCASTVPVAPIAEVVSKQARFQVLVTEAGFAVEVKVKASTPPSNTRSRKVGV